MMKIKFDKEQTVQFLSYFVEDAIKIANEKKGVNHNEKGSVVKSIRDGS